MERLIGKTSDGYVVVAPFVFGTRGPPSPDGKSGTIGSGDPRVRPRRSPTYEGLSGTEGGVPTDLHCVRVGFDTCFGGRVRVSSPTDQSSDKKLPTKVVKFVTQLQNL